MINSSTYSAPSSSSSATAATRSAAPSQAKARSGSSRPAVLPLPAAGKLVRSQAVLPPPDVSVREWVGRALSDGRWKAQATEAQPRTGGLASPQSPSTASSPESPLSPFSPAEPVDGLPDSERKSSTRAARPRGRPWAVNVAPPGGRSDTPSPAAEDCLKVMIRMIDKSADARVLVADMGRWLVKACAADTPAAAERLASAAAHACRGTLHLETALREGIQDQLKETGKGMEPSRTGALFKGLTEGFAANDERANIFRQVRLLAAATRDGSLDALQAGMASFALGYALDVRKHPLRLSDMLDCLVHFKWPQASWTRVVRGLAQACGGPDMVLEAKRQVSSAMLRRVDVQGPGWLNAGLLGLREATGSYGVSPADRQSRRPPG